MPLQDFLITFKADTSGALTQINALASRVAEVDRALNTAVAGLNRAAGGAGASPIANLAQGAPAAASGIKRINNELLDMGRRIDLDTEEVDALLARLRQLKTAFAIGTVAGRGPSVNQGQVNEALSIIQRLSSAQQISGEVAEEWAREITAAYAKVASIPQELRNLPVAEQQRISALRSREIAQRTGLEQTRQPVGGMQNLAAHQRALESYIVTVRQLGEYSLASAADLDRLEAELVQVRAASQLASQRVANERTVGGLRERANAIRLQQQAGAFSGDPGRELTQMRALERTLVDLQSRGDPVQRELEETRAKIQQLTSAASLASQRLREMNTAQSLRGRATDLRQQISGGRFANVGAELTAVRQLENTLYKLQQRGDPVEHELAQVRAEVDRLAAAATKARSLDQLLRRRGSLENRLESRNIRGGDNRDLIRAAMRNEEALRDLGDPQAASRLNTFRQQFAALPPVIDASTRRMIEFNRALMQRTVMGERLNLPQQSPATLAKGLNNSVELMRRGFDEGAEGVEFFQERVANLPPTLDRVAQGMLNHGRRVAEGLFIYEALGRAMQAVGDQIRLINDLAREQIRFSAVAGGLGAGGGSQFLLGLQDIAVRTNTPMADLAAQIDTVGAAMLTTGDASERLANSQRFLNDAGQFTNITTRHLATETENLLGIYKQTGDSTEQFSDRLGRIVRAGNNSSRIISEVTDVLSEAGRSARATGFDFDFLASIGGQLSQELIGTMSGSEIGGMLNTIIGRLTDPDVINKIQDLSNGIIGFANADGSLRDTHSILIDIFEAIRNGTIDAESGRAILDQIVPPLNPAARAFVTALERNIPQAVEDMGRIMGGGAEDAKALNDALLTAPGERFAASIKEIQGALTGIFSEEVIQAGNNFADILKAIANLLGSGEEGGGIGGGIASITAKLLLFGAAMAGISFAWRNLSLMLLGSRRRMEEIRAIVIGTTAAVETNTVAAAASATAQGAVATTTAASATAATVAARSVFTLSGAWAALRGALVGVLGVAKGLLPILVAMAAIELPGQIEDSAAAGNLREGALARTLLRREDLNAALNNVNAGPASGFLELVAKSLPSDLTSNQRHNILEVAKALTELEKQGKLTAASQKAIEEQILNSSGAIKEEKTNSEELLSSMDVLINTTNDGTAAWDAYTEAGGQIPGMLDDMSAAEQRAAESLRINIGLSDERAEALVRLTDQLRAGTITVEEWVQGQQDIGAASEAAAGFIAAYGDQLNLIPGLQERMAATGEGAAEALTNILSENPETAQQQIDIINRMIELAEMVEETDAALESNPLTPRVDNAGFAKETDTFSKLALNSLEINKKVGEAFKASPITPQVNLSPMATQFKSMLRMFGIMSKSASTLQKSFGPKNLGGLSKTASNLGDIQSELEALADSLGVLGTIREGDSRLESERSREPSQTGIIDIGDLPASSIAQIIAIAAAAQRRVVAAGGVVDTDETAAIFKDAAFQRLIAGIDQRFLQQAIEELTEVEKRRLELEQMRLQDVTRSMVTQVGPIQSIVSAPVLSAGGGVLSGQGLNADPRLGNFTINVPINWSGMSLPQLQTFIVESIAKAWIDAGRGG